MQHLRSLEQISLSASWVTIGSFDGVHRGHQALVGSLVKGAHAAGLPAVAITFHPHPVVVLRNLQDPYYLTTPEERADLLAALGVDYVITLPFTHSLAALTAEEFMDLLSKSLGLRSLWVGPGFALGRNRKGDVDTLRRIGETLGYTVNVLEPVTGNGDIISSSHIRSLLQSGRVTEAARLLGRLYSVTGQVVHGAGRGRGLGIPTANLEVAPQRILPASGIYATWVLAGGQRLTSVTNVGVNPTFEDQPPAPRVEAHILDFDRDLYDTEITVEFVEYLRPEERFDTVDEMMEQIARDVTTAREVLTHAP